MKTVEMLKSYSLKPLNMNKNATKVDFLKEKYGISYIIIYIK